MQSKHKNRSKTSHLSLEQIENLKSEYYNGSNIQNLVEKYGIDIHPNNLCSTFPLIAAPNMHCKYCNSMMYFVPPLKSDKNKKEYFCTTCHHAEGIFGCKCTYCLKKKYDTKLQSETTKLLKRKKNTDDALKIREYPNSPSLNMLSIKEKAYLGALLRVGLDKKYLLIGLEYGIPQELAPTQEYQELLVAELLERKIITGYYPSKNISNKVAKDLLGKTLYDICVSDVNRNKEELITHLMYPNKIPSYMHDDTIILLKEIQIYEATDYMILTLQQFNLPIFQSEQKYKILFMQILNEYSEGQLFNFIYIAIRNQAAYNKTNNHRYIPMANYVYKKISDRYEQARSNNWEITNFRRAWKGEQSELSKLVDSRLLDIGESAFYQVMH